VTNLAWHPSMFGYAVLFNGDVCSCDVAGITGSYDLLYYSTLFNGGVSSLNVLGVTVIFGVFVN
jgi:hypothetical protein